MYTWWNIRHAKVIIAWRQIIDSTNISLPVLCSVAANTRTDLLASTYIFFCRCCVYTLPHSVILHVCVCGGEKDLSIDVSFICRCVSTYVCLYMHATPKRVDKCGRNMEPLVARRSVGRYSVWYILLHRMPICFYVPTIYWLCLRY